MTYIERLSKIASAKGNPINFNTAKILDFGCGSAAMLLEERSKGRDIFGCDIADSLEAVPKDLIRNGIVGEIDLNNYRIPFEDKTFDMIVSNQVFEHVMNYEEVLREIRRVLKPGGIAIHIFPSRYTPIEPHVHVPFATIVRSRRWLKLWACLGIRNEYQKGLTPEKVAEVNLKYLCASTNYLTKKEVLRCAQKYFVSVTFAEREYLSAGAGYGPVLAKVPLLSHLFGVLGNRVMVIS